LSTASGPESATAGHGTISLGHLIALNDEIAAMVRAGMPLERGLVGMGGDVRGRLGAISTALAARLNQGETLPQALAAEGDRFPPVYRAVVDAGMKAGRLSAALEGLARFARSYAEVRGAVGLALLYPLIVLMMAYGLFVLFVVLVVPRFLLANGSLGVTARSPLVALEWLGARVPYWGPVLPILLALIALAWIQSSRSLVLQPGWRRGLVRHIPWMRSLMAATEAAGFADLLALLIEHQVPFPEAVVLAAEASGDGALVATARELADAARRGESLSQSVRGPSALPPLLRWLIATGQEQGMLVSALRHAAQVYRRRAIDQAELIRVFLPTVLLFVLGGTATLVLALSLFLPMTSLLKGLVFEI
jgi:type II secretory pathway component PulF